MIEAVFTAVVISLTLLALTYGHSRANREPFYAKVLVPIIIAAGVLFGVLEYFL